MHPFTRFHCIFSYLTVMMYWKTTLKSTQAKGSNYNWRSTRPKSVEHSRIDRTCFVSKPGLMRPRVPAFSTWMCAGNAETSSKFRMRSSMIFIQWTWTLKKAISSTFNGLVCKLHKFEPLVYLMGLLRNLSCPYMNHSLMLPINDRPSGREAFHAPALRTIGHFRTFETDIYCSFSLS